MTEDVATGSCLCGAIRYEIAGNLGLFQYCHCSRCRKFTGSAHSANLLVRPDQFRWLAGEDSLGRYEPPDSRHFATVFCRGCGCSLPWLAKTGRAVVVPAGTLDTHPGIQPMQNVFWGSRADWYVAASELPCHEALPPK